MYSAAQATAMAAKECLRPYLIEAVGSDQEETAMNGNRAFVVVAIMTAVGVLGVASAAASDHERGSSRERGYVVPCSLAGVNPVYHPEIFGNAAAAYAFGFVRSRDGSWQVHPNCHR
jgi:hypothetical protein